MSNTSHFKTSIIFTVVAIMLLIAPANAELDIILDKLSPQPVEPGQDITMAITLSNQNADVNGVRLTIFPDSPIILKNDNDRVINENNIIKYGAIVETYLLHIDPRAVSGVYEIEFEAQWMSNGQRREINKTFKIIVQGVPQLAVSNITIYPDLISPKDTFNLTFSVSNEGTGIAREVQINAATIGLPFVPVGSDTKIIKNLGQNESIQLNYNLLVKDKTLISSYSIPIKMDYKDENGKNLSSQSFVGVKVLGNAELSIENIKTDPQNPAKGDAVIITMRIENSGNGDARSVKVKLNIPFEGTRTAFLGKIKPDDDAPGVFTFYTTDSGDIPYNASIEFEDDLGKHTVNEALTLNVRNTNKNGIIIPVIVIVLVAGAFVFYFFHSRKSRQ
jgi:hypothetical protein